MAGAGVSDFKRDQEIRKALEQFSDEEIREFAIDLYATLSDVSAITTDCAETVYERLRRGNFKQNNVTISIDSSSGMRALSDRQMKNIVEEIQRQLLRNAKRSARSRITPTEDPRD